MDLIEFNAENTTSKSVGTPSVHVSIKNGTVSFGRYAMEFLKLKPKSQIKLFHEKKDTENWYLEIVEEKGFMLRQESKSHYNIRFGNKALTDKIGEVFNVKKSIRFLIAGKPTFIGKRNLWGLIKIKGE